MSRNAPPPDPEENVPHEPLASETLERHAEEQRRAAERTAGTDARIREARERLRREGDPAGEEEEP